MYDIFDNEDNKIIDKGLRPYGYLGVDNSTNIQFPTEEEFKEYKKENDKNYY